MDTEEDEAHHVPNVDSSVQLEDSSVTTATPSELQNQNTESICEHEPVSVSNEPGLPAPSVLSHVSEMEEEGDEMGFVDAEVVPEQASEAAVGDDSILSQEKHEMLDAAVEIKESGDGGDSHAAGEKADIVEDVAEKANVLDEILTSEGIEVSMSEQQFVELSEVAEEREIADAAEVDGETGIISVKEETNVAVEVNDPTEQTMVMEEREVAAVSVKRELLVEEQQVVNGVEQSGIMEKTGVDNMAEESEFLDKPVKGETFEETGGTDMVLNVSEQTGNLDIHAARELGMGMTEADKDPAVEEESEKAEDKRLENLVEDVNKAERTATEIGDRTEAEDPVMKEETEKAEDTEFENVVEDVDKDEGVATEMGDMTEAEDLVMEEESKKPQDTELENVVEDVEKAEGTGTAIGDMAEVEDPVMEDESEKAEDTELENRVKDVDKVEGTATEMEDMSEAEDPVMEEESEKAEDTELENVAEDVENAEETATQMEDTTDVTEAVDDTEMRDMKKELETEDAEEIKDGSKTSGGKRKRGKKQNNKVLAKGPTRKKAEEDVCFICFDGGDLVLCDRRGCPKAYHSACVGRDEAFFQTKGKWNCVKLAGVGFSEGTGSSIISFAQHTIKVLHAPQIGLMALKRTFEA